MSRLRRALALTTVATTAMTLGGTGWSEASPVGGEETQRHGHVLNRAEATSAPGIASRGSDRGGGRREAQPPPGEEPPAEPEETRCPEDQWFLPVQINGLACLLLLPNPEEPPAGPPAL
jgi:hypothetical protein